MNEQNPYEPKSSEPAIPLRRIPWLRCFAILNCVIVSIPVLGAFAAYLVSEANDMQVSGVSVTMGAELGVLLNFYVAIPNSLMFFAWLRAPR